MISLLESIAGHFEFFFNSVASGVESIVSIIPLSFELVSHAPAFLGTFMGIILAFGFVKFVLSLF